MIAASVLASTLGAPTADRARRKRAQDRVEETLDEGRPLIHALESAGWRATPEGSDRFEPGHIYDAVHALQADRERCFEAQPRESIYNELEVSLALKAGARVPLGLVSAEASGVRYKRLTYADPRVRELAGMDLRPTPACRAYLEERRQAGDDLSTWYVIQAVLLAVVNEQECTEVAAGVRAPVGGGSVSVSEECSVGSTGQVAVAYKLQTASALLGPAPAAAVSAPTPPAAAAPRSPPPVASRGGWTSRALWPSSPARTRPPEPPRASGRRSWRAPGRRCWTRRGRPGIGWVATPISA